jgi:hypothetical protein
MTREYYRLTALNGALLTPTNRVPSKAAGRKGTRRAWKRAHPPGWFHKLFAQPQRPLREETLRRISTGIKHHLDSTASFCDAFRSIEKG